MPVFPLAGGFLVGNEVLFGVNPEARDSRIKSLKRAASDGKEDLWPYQKLNLEHTQAGTAEVVPMFCDSQPSCPISISIPIPIPISS